jgi:hypothetical protein
MSASAAHSAALAFKLLAEGASVLGAEVIPSVRAWCEADRTSRSFCAWRAHTPDVHARRPPARHAAARQSQWKSSWTAATSTLAGGTFRFRQTADVPLRRLWAAMCQKRPPASQQHYLYWITVSHCQHARRNVQAKDLGRLRLMTKFGWLVVPANHPAFHHSECGRRKHLVG